MSEKPEEQSIDYEELQLDRFHEECGVFGIIGDPEAAHLTYLGLHALQHRGQEGAGIACSDGGLIRAVRGRGLVHEVFGGAQLSGLHGSLAIGHNRYSTAGEDSLRNVQPFVVRYANGQIAIAHNGNLVNATQLREELEARGSIFTATSDTEVLLHLIATSQQSTIINRLVDALSRVQGAYSLLVSTEDTLVAVRDPWGFRPLVLGRKGTAWVVCSETCALDLIGATYLREVEPGEMVIIDPREGLQSLKPLPRRPRRACIFEHIYFARPDSTVFGRSVYETRHTLGRLLARMHPVEADAVVPVPDSGVPAALGYVVESGIPYQLGLLRSHYVGRTFIEPSQQIRDFDAGRDRARHLQPKDGAPGAKRRGPRGAPAHLGAAHHRELLLRHRHAEPRGADRAPHGSGGNSQLPRGGQRGLPDPRRAARGPGRGPRALLRGLLQRRLPRRGPVRGRERSDAVVHARVSVLGRARPRNIHSVTTMR